MLIDLHVYTDASDGPTLDRVLAQAKELGLDAICVADPRASAEVARAVAAEGIETDVAVFVGVELPTLAGDVIVIPPALDPFLIHEEWRELDVFGVPSLEELREVVERVGAVVLGAHPYDRKRKSAPRDRIFTMDAFAGLEIWTADADREANRAAAEAVANARVPAFAGSATKRSSLPSNTWVTLLGESPTTQAELVKVLRKGNFWPAEIVTDEGRSGGRSNRGRRR